MINGVNSVGFTSFMTGMDNVRNLTGNPIAGVDPHELIDTRPILQEMQVGMASRCAQHRSGVGMQGPVSRSARKQAHGLPISSHPAAGATFDVLWGALPWTSLGRPAGRREREGGSLSRPHVAIPSWPR